MGYRAETTDGGGTNLVHLFLTLHFHTQTAAAQSIPSYNSFVHLCYTTTTTFRSPIKSSPDQHRRHVGPRMGWVLLL